MQIRAYVEDKVRAFVPHHKYDFVKFYLFLVPAVAKIRKNILYLIVDALEICVHVVAIIIRRFEMGSITIPIVQPIKIIMPP